MTTAQLPVDGVVADPDVDVELSLVLPVGFDPDAEFHQLQRLRSVDSATRWQLVAADCGGDAAISILLGDAVHDALVVDVPGADEPSALQAALARCTGRTTWIPADGVAVDALLRADPLLTEAMAALAAGHADVIVDDRFGLIAPTRLLRGAAMRLPQLHPSRRSLLHALAADLAGAGSAVTLSQPPPGPELTPLLLSLIEDGSASALALRLLATSPVIACNPAPVGGRDYLGSMTALAGQFAPSLAGTPAGEAGAPSTAAGLNPAEFSRRALRGMWQEFSGYCRETAPQARYWAEQVGPAAVPTVLPAPHIIVLVSDPRDVWCSLGSAAPGSAPQAPSGGPGAHRRAALERFQRSVTELVGRRYPDAARVLLVRHEDLLTDPRGQARRLGAWLGVTLDAGAILGDDPDRDTGNAAPPRWTRDLATAEARLLTDGLARELALLGYPAAIEDELAGMADRDVRAAATTPAPIVTTPGIRRDDATLRCPVCQETELAASITKADVPYWKCQTCEALFAEVFDPSVIVTHNNAPGHRADPHVQATRLQRMSDHLGHRPRKILDFGCGLGYYVEYLNGNGYDAVGIDQDTALQLSDLRPGEVDAINMVEVIEHLLQPKDILRRLIEILAPGGVLYLETSFVDYLGDPATSGYIDPRIGHCCIHSRRSVEHLAWYLRVELAWVNNNVFILRKR